ncbi:unnamed protein product [Bubo scandiacus]
MAAVSVFPGVRLLTIGDANGEIQRHQEQQPLRLEVRTGPDSAGLALYGHEDVCVFKCSVSRETECSRGGQTVLHHHAGLQQRPRPVRHPPPRADGGVLGRAVLPVLRVPVPAAEHDAGLRPDGHLPASHPAEPQATSRDKIVLDVGCGSGILSFFAAQAGARKIYAVEASTMAQHAEVLVKSNNLTERIVVIPGKVEEVSLPEQVDIIISEPMGYMLFNERMLESYLHAKKYLKPSGNMFPTIGDVHLAPFTDEQLYMEQFTKANFWYQPSFHGVDLVPRSEGRPWMNISGSLMTSPLFAKAGDTLSGTCLLIANKRQSYDISNRGSGGPDRLQVQQPPRPEKPLLQVHGDDPLAPPPAPTTPPPRRTCGTRAATYNMSTGMAVAGMPAAYDLSSVIAGGSNVGHNNLIPLANTGIVNHTHSRMGSIMSTGIVQGSSSAQSGRRLQHPLPPQQPVHHGGPRHLHGLPHVHHHQHDALRGAKGAPPGLPAPGKPKPEPPPAHPPRAGGCREGF